MTAPYDAGVLGLEVVVPEPQEAIADDLVWGPADEANRANFDSFYFTNITPQMNNFNQSFRHGLWGLLENAILEQTSLEKRRVSVFAGPILTDDDVPYRGTLVPKAFWKVLVYVLDAELRASAFVLQQKVDPGPTIDLDEFAPYQVDLLDLEDRTQLMHPALEGLPSASRRMPGGRLLESLDDVDW